MTRYVLVSLLAFLLTALAGPPLAAQALSARVDTVRVEPSSARAPRIDTSQAPVPVTPVAATPAAARAAGPVRGVVWGPPGSAVAARADLRRMRAAGFTAVRTTVLPDTLLAEAQRLGLAVYAELPVDYPTASRLAAARPDLLRQIAALGVQARRYPVLRHVGLARRPDVGAPGVCRALQALASAARQARLVPYVVSSPGGAACAGVGMVLVDRLGPGPSGPLSDHGKGWPGEVDGVAVGYLVGAPVLRGRQGVETPGSAERQARLVAEVLRTASAPVFVVQWRDGGALGQDTPRLDGYGLHTADDRPRRAFAVARDVLLGRRTAFVYPEPSRPYRPGTDATVWFWIAVAFAGLVFATEPRLRPIVPRFFRSPSFFRDSVRDTRGTMVAAMLGHWVSLALMVGVFASVLVQAAHGTDAFAALLALLPRAVGRGAAGLTAHPGLVVVFVALLYAVLTGLWAYGFVLVARRRYHLSLWQAVMLIVWHRWPLVPITLAALVLVSAATPLPVLGVWAAGFCAVAALAAGRSVLDLVLMTRLPAWWAVVLFVGQPLVVLALVLLAWIGPEEVAFLSRLAR